MAHRSPAAIPQMCNVPGGADNRPRTAGAQFGLRRLLERDQERDRRLGVRAEGEHPVAAQQDGLRTRSRLDQAAAGKIDVGGDLTVNRLGFGAMRITGSGIGPRAVAPRRLADPVR
jgi:hypothetical protein